MASMQIRLIPHKFLKLAPLTILMSGLVSGAFAPLMIPMISLAQTTSQFVGDAEVGKKIFKKCKACHKIGEDAKNSTGPVLNNIVGRPAGSYKGYKYGKGMKAAALKGLVWDEEQIFNYILNPKKYLRAYLGDKKAKAKMKFKLKKEDQRRDVIAYLLSVSWQADESDTLSQEEMQKNLEMAKQMPQHQAGEDQICVQNNFSKKLVLTVEDKSGARQVKSIERAGVLCITAIKGASGSVGVFENEDSLEGCSRLANAGKTQVLVDYAAYDNCMWAD